VSFAAVIPFAQRHFRIEYQWGRIIRLYAIAVVGFFSRRLLTVEGPLASISGSLMLWLIAMLVVAVGVLSRAERRALQATASAQTRAMIEALRTSRRAPTDGV
jgi:hypothetical protein